MIESLEERQLFDGEPLTPDADLARLPAEIECHWPKMLVDMLDVARDALAHAGANEERAREIAIIVMRALARYHGGHSFYLPRGLALEMALKNYRIFLEMGKLSIHELSVKYGMSEVHIYRIIAKQRALARDRARAAGSAT